MPSSIWIRKRPPLFHGVSKKEGDFVKFEESVLTVETEKVAIDVPAPASGTLAGILYRARITPFQWTLGCLREEVARKMDDLMS